MAKSLAEQLKDAHATITDGQASGNQATVDAGMAAQGQILKDNGIIYPTGNKGAGVDTSVPLPKSWTGGSSGGGSSSGESYDNSAYLKQQAAAQVEAELVNLKHAYQNAMLGYDAAEEKLPATYQQAKNQAAAQNAMEKRAFDERAVADGLNSGTNGQAQLAMSSMYQAQLAGLDRERAQKQSDIQMEKAKLQAEYEAAIAQARAQGDASLASALYQELLRVQGLEREDQQIADANKREDDLLQKQWNRQDLLLKNQTDREDALLDREDANAEREYARQLALHYGLIDPTNIWKVNSLEDLASLSAGTVAVSGGNLVGGGRVDNGGLADWQVREMQGHYGLTQDGKWGPNSQSTTGMSAQQAWTAYQAARARTSIGFDEDEGTITWNGKTYRVDGIGTKWGSEALFADLYAANLTKTEVAELNRKMKPYGIELEWADE